MANGDDRLLTIEDLAERLQCSPRHARTLVYGDRRRGREPEIRSFLVGERLRRLAPEDVDEYVRRSRQAATQ